MVHAGRIENKRVANSTRKRNRHKYKASVPSRMQHHTPNIKHKITNPDAYCVSTSTAGCAPAPLWNQLQPQERFIGAGRRMQKPETLSEQYNRRSHNCTLYPRFGSIRLTVHTAYNYQKRCLHSHTTFCEDQVNRIALLVCLSCHYTKKGTVCTTLWQNLIMSYYLVSIAIHPTHLELSYCQLYNRHYTKDKLMSAHYLACSMPYDVDPTP